MTISLYQSVRSCKKLFEESIDNKSRGYKFALEEVSSAIRTCRSNIVPFIAGFHVLKKLDDKVGSNMLECLERFDQKLVEVNRLIMTSNFENTILEDKEIIEKKISQILIGGIGRSDCEIPSIVSIENILNGKIN